MISTLLFTPENKRKVYLIKGNFTLVLRYLKLTRLILTRIEGKNYSPTKEINAKEGVKFQTEEN